MKAIGIIIATESSPSLGSLTANRSNSSVPVTSAFRTIDFSISNMSNSGIKKIGIISQSNTKSLFDHLRSSKWWNIGRKKGGLFVLSPSISNTSTNFYRGTADAIHQNIEFLTKSLEEFVVITNGDCIYKIDFNDAITAHANSDADITIVTQKNTRNYNMRELCNVVLDNNGRVTQLEEKPLEPISDTYFTGIYIIRRELLIKILIKMAEDHRYRMREDLLHRYRNTLKIQSFDLKSYWSSIHTTTMYFNANMDFLKDDVRKTFREGSSIYTKSKDLPPVKYNFTANVKNCIIGRGSIIDGNVFNSIIFRNVKIGVNSTIKNCIIFEQTVIGDNVHLENVILDKNCLVDNDLFYIGNPNKIKVFEKGRHITSIEDRL